MSQIHSTHISISTCLNSRDKQTVCSVVLRTIAVSLGIISLLAGMLILAGVPYLNQLGTTVGWSTLSIGAFLTFMSLIIKCVIQETHKEKPKSILASLPNEMNLQILDYLDENSLINFAHTSKENWNLVYAQFPNFIRKRELQTEAFHAWIESTKIIDPDVPADILTDDNIQEIAALHYNEMIELYSEALLRAENVNCKNKREVLAPFVRVLPACTRINPVEAKSLVERTGKILNHANPPKLNDEDLFYARALVIIDPDHAYIQQVLNQTRWPSTETWVIYSIFKELSLHNIDTAFTLVNVLKDEKHKTVAITTIIRVATTQQQNQLNQILKQASSFTNNLTDSLAKEQISYEIGKGYVSMREFDVALEMIDSLSNSQQFETQLPTEEEIIDGISSQKGKLIAHIARNYVNNDPEKCNAFLLELLSKARQLYFLPIEALAIKLECCIAEAFLKVNPQQTQLLLNDGIRFEARFIESTEFMSHLFEVYFQSLSTPEEISSFLVELNELSIERKIAVLSKIAAYIKTSDQTVSASFKKIVANIDKRYMQSVHSLVLCELAKNCASIDTKKAEQWLQIVKQDITKDFSSHAYLIPSFIAAYAVVDYKKTISVIKTAFKKHPLAQAIAYLSLAQTL